MNQDASNSENPVPANRVPVERVPVENPVPAEMISASLNFRSFFAEMFAIFKAHWAIFLGNGVALTILLELREFARWQISFPQNPVPAAPPMPLWTISCLASLLAFPLFFGIFQIVRKTNLGERVSWRDAFPFRAFWILPEFLIASLLASILVYFPMPIFGLIFLANLTSDLEILFILTLATGAISLLWLIYFLIRQLFFVFALFDDENCGVVRSLNVAWRITRGRFWRTFSLAALPLIPLFFGIPTLSLTLPHVPALAPILIFLVPATLISLSVLYLKLLKNSPKSPPVPAAGTLKLFLKKLLFLLILAAIFFSATSFFNSLPGNKFHYLMDEIEQNSPDSRRFFVVLFPKPETQFYRALFCELRELNDEFIEVSDGAGTQVARENFTIFPPENYQIFFDRMAREFCESPSKYRSMNFDFDGENVRLKICDVRGRRDTFVYRVFPDQSMPFPQEKRCFVPATEFGNAVPADEESE